MKKTTNKINKERLKGAWTALITPFNADESIDWKAFDKLIEKQLEAEITGIVLNGTTGESPTITDKEIVELIKKAKKKINGKCFLMVGTGTNSTKKTIEKTKMAEKSGADAILVVNPYYNKPTQEGLYLHFKAVANSTKLPVVLYNIKGRTAVNLETPTLERLVKNTKNIIAVKEASGDLEQIKAVCDLKLNNFSVLSGDDNLTFKIIKDYGADGVISVASNIIPKEIVQMTNLALNGKIQEAEKINIKLDDLFKKLFIETNPIPIKYSAFKMNLCKNIYRLPMCKISKENSIVVEKLLKEMNLIK